MQDRDSVHQSTCVTPGSTVGHGTAHPSARESRSHPALTAASVLTKRNPLGSTVVRLGAACRDESWHATDTIRRATSNEILIHPGESVTEHSEKRERKHGTHSASMAEYCS